MLKFLVGSSVVMAAIVGVWSGNWVVAGILFFSFLAIDVIVFKDFV
jgi:hypothetical protein